MKYGNKFETNANVGDISKLLTEVTNPTKTLLISGSAGVNMDYITEKTGGWDEWSDEYNQVMGLELDTGKTIETRFIEDLFMDLDGNTIKVELPMRRVGKEITLERYNPSYTVTSVTLRQLEDHIDQERQTIFFNDISEKYDFDPS